MHRIAATALACLTLAAGAAPAEAAPVTGPDAAGATRLRLAWSAGPAAGSIVTAPAYLAGSTYHLEGVADPDRIHPRTTLAVDSGIVYFQQSATRHGPAYLVSMRASTGAVLSRVRIWRRGSVGDVAVDGGRVFTKALNERTVAFAPARRRTPA